MGPDQRAELDGFSVFLPFPYRVAVILVAGRITWNSLNKSLEPYPIPDAHNLVDTPDIGFWGWGANLQYLQQINIDLPALIRYPARQSPNQRPHHVSAYHLATLLTIPLVLSLLIFWPVTHGSKDRVESVDYIPQAYLFLFLILLVLPFNRVSQSGRRRFLATLRRISIGGLAEAQDGKFGDILLADALTSYAKVLADLAVTFCMFFSKDTSSTSKPNRHCGSDYMAPLIIAIPSMIRLRQCLIEYVRVRRMGYRNGNNGGQHLANAVKYASAFPVIILAAKLRHYSPFLFYRISEVTLTRLLYFFSLVNSSYTFYWDITKDWDLTLLTASRNDKEHPYGLRRHRHFTDRQYYLAIIVDLVLRFSWTSRFIPGLGWLNETEVGLFILMFLEVARRWMWVFLRTEAEWVRNSRGPAPDDILLGEFSHKLDRD